MINRLLIEDKWGITTFAEVSDYTGFVFSDNYICKNKDIEEIKGIELKVTRNGNLVELRKAFVQEALNLLSPNYNGTMECIKFRDYEPPEITEDTIRGKIYIVKYKLPPKKQSRRIINPSPS